MRYELGFYIPEDEILHSHRRENLIYKTSYMAYNSSYLQLHIYLHNK
jgi:hypothetical protein